MPEIDISYSTSKNTKQNLEGNQSGEGEALLERNKCKNY